MPSASPSVEPTANVLHPRRRTLRTWVSDSLHDLFFELVALPGKTAQTFILDRVFSWKYRAEDPWSLRASAYEQTRFARMLDLLPDRSYPRVLEVGCAEGAFTHKLADAIRGAEILGVDVSDKAISRAQTMCQEKSQVTLRVMNVLSGLPEGPFDLVFCSEVLYYLDQSQRRRLAAELGQVMAPGGLLVSSNIFPRAKFLHRELARAPALQLVTEQHFFDEPPGYSLALFQRTAAR